MLSSDKNVETIVQLIEQLKHYLGLHTEYAKLTVIDKVVRLLTAVALAILFIILAVAVLLFFWIGTALWLSHFIGLAGAFLLVSGIHLIVLILFFVFRKSWIERPLVRFLADLLMS
ncbi:MAG: phage holin family protein [Prevotella sp.]|nr:phage holin family protein [Prevotella sp.]